MNKNAHYNPKSKKWIISLLVMVILSVAVIGGTICINKIVTEKANAPVDITVEVARTSPKAVEENELGVTGVESAFDNQGNLVGYVVKTQMVGYNQEVPIEIASTITVDGSVVCGIEVLKQEETEYLGVRIQQDDFKNQFSSRRLPVAGSSGIEKGSKVDLIAKSTISSQAVVDSVNNAADYVIEYLAQ